MRYTIYRTTNLLNGKFYIGKHQTENPNDGYLGSGKTLCAAIRLHGVEAFKKEILFDFDSQAEMDSKEKELITDTLVHDPNCYNVGIGGEGGPHFKGRFHSVETKRKQSLANLGRKNSPETRQKISKRVKGFKMSEEAKFKISFFRKNGFRYHG